MRSVGIIRASDIIIRRVLFILLIMFCNVMIMKGQNKPFSIEVGGSLAITNFQWSIAGNLQGQSPNILSELTFEKIIATGGYLTASYKLAEHLTLTASFQKNTVISGNGTDADYKENNRMDATYQVSFNSNKGVMDNFRIGCAYNIIASARFKLNTELFFANSLQNFNILDLNYQNLNSTYKANWKSADIGVSGSYALTKRLSVLGAMSYGLNKYNSEADWNLIEIFRHPISFKQHANGDEFEGRAGLNYMLNSNFSILLCGKLGQMRSYKGLDTSFLQNGNEVKTQFNGANDNFYELKLGAMFSF